MTEIDFHFNTPDKVNYACRLLRKAVGARGARVVVVADASMLDAVDLALWTCAPTEFVAHCRSSAGSSEPHTVARSPVVLAEAASGRCRISGCW
ncbi:MAG: DNA polymerase III subunit chi [Variovorax sp.]